MNKPTVQTALANPAKELALACNQFLADSEVPVLLLIAGGSVRTDVLPYLDVELCTESVTLGILDERFTTHTAALNQGQLRETKFYQRAVEHGAQEIVVGLHSDPEITAAAWEALWRDWKRTNPTGQVVVLAGVGDDGHIAGILPLTQEELPAFTSESWLVEHVFSQSSNPYPHRLTPTFTWWQKEVAYVGISMKGVKKQTALEAVLAAEGDLLQTPARVVWYVPACTIYTDIDG